MDIRAELGALLTGALSKDNIPCYWAEKGLNQTDPEYLVYRVENEKAISFANDRALIRKCEATVIYYAETGHYGYDRIERIKTTLRQNGYSLPNGETDLELPDQPGLRAVSMTFVIDRVDADQE